MTPTPEQDWANRAKRYVKAELKRAGVTYDELAQRLRRMGFEETEASITNKLSRGTFSAVFLLTVMKAIGIRAIRMEDIEIVDRS